MHFFIGSFDKKNNMDPQQRFQAIQAKEADLRRREEALRAQSVQLDDTKQPNFPPFVHLVYHNISEEIPIRAQWTVRLAFFGLIGLAIGAIVNFIAACTVGTIGTSESHPYSLGKNIVFSLIIGALAVPLYFKINYFKLYENVKTDLKMTWFALQALWIGCVGLGLAGLKNSGLIGVITLIDAISKSTSGFCKIMCIISTAFWGLLVFLNVFLFGKVMVLFKTSGISQLSPTPVQ